MLDQSNGISFLPSVTFLQVAQQVSEYVALCRIRKSFRLEKTSEFIKSNHQPSIAKYSFTISG